MPSSLRSIFRLAAIVAMLVSALGIAYMAAQSSPDELAIVDARTKKLQALGQALGLQIQSEVRSLVKMGDTQGESSLGGMAVQFTLDGDLLLPNQRPLQADEDSGIEAILPGKGFANRQRNLVRARKLEMGHCYLVKDPVNESCQDALTQRKTSAALYEALVDSQDTGGQALLGLARLHRREKAFDLAAARYRQLLSRYDGRNNPDGVSFSLLAMVGLSEVEVGAEDSLNLLRRLLARQFAAPQALLALIAQQAILRVESRDVSEAQVQELAEVKKRLQHVEASASIAEKLRTMGKGIAFGVPRDGKSLQLPWARDETLVLLPSSTRISGMIVKNRRIAQVARQQAAQEGLLASVGVNLVQQGGGVDDAQGVQAQLSPLLPHLRIVLSERGEASEAMTEISRARKRHRLITGGLVGLLLVGLIVTLRGAAKERELSRLKSDFVSTVSHELKTPLTSIRMFAEMLQEGVAEGDAGRESHYQSVIVKESERLGLLIANLLDYSQIEKGTSEYRHSSVKAASICEEAAASFRRLGEDEEKLLSQSWDKDDPTLIVADKEVLVQCLLNLLSNAFKYGEGTQVCLQMNLDAGGQNVQFIVKDGGRGIASSEQQRIFEEFFRSPDVVKSAIEGTGLGLALVKRHVEAQGGRVRVSSILGAGSTFTIQLPRERA